MKGAVGLLETEGGDHTCYFPGTGGGGNTVGTPFGEKATVTSLQNKLRCFLPNHLKKKKDKKVFHGLW